MSSWNHRVIRTKDEHGTYYNIHECYYNAKEDKIPFSWTENPTSPFSDEGVEGLRWTLERMLKALDVPVLEQVGDVLKEIVN